MDAMTSLSESSSFWGSVGAIGAVVVLVGVIGEGLAEWPIGCMKDWPRLNAFGKFSWGILVFGLAVELLAVASKDSDDSKIIANLNSQAGEIRRDNLLLEREVNPRRLSPAQFASFVDMLAKHPTAAVRISSYENDPDAAVLGWQMLNAVRAAGLKPDENLLSHSALGGIMFGTLVSGTDAELVKQSLELLSSFGLYPSRSPPPVSAGVHFGGEGLSFPLVIFVGAKPPPDMAP